MIAGRYHLTMTADDREVLHGLWASETAARGKFTASVGRHGDRPQAHLTLTDEETDRTLTQWPDPQ